MVDEEDDLLFSSHQLRDLFDQTINRLKDEIDHYDGNKLLNTSTDDLARYFESKYSFEPIIIRDNIEIGYDEADIDITNRTYRKSFGLDGRVYKKGTVIIVYIPYEGDSELFKCRPSTFTLSPPHGVVNEAHLEFKILVTHHDSEKIKRDIDRNIEDIEQYVNSIRKDVDQFNESLKSKILSLVENRKEKLLKDKGLVASLGYPLKRRENVFDSYVPSELRRRIHPRPPEASSQPYVPEPEIPIEEYEYIIDIIISTANTLERSPNTFSGMGEEQLRDQFLVPLNSHYEGQATGETFNSHGKTDILIRVEDKNIFIAECKIWNGPSSLKEAIDQLLSYGTWRDTKTAILIFNRNKNLTNVLKQIPNVVHGHPNYKRNVDYSNETGFRFVMSHPTDEQREIILTVLVFDVPT